MSLRELLRLSLSRLRTSRLRAALTTIRELRRREVPAYLDRLGRELQERLNGVAAETGMPLLALGQHLLRGIAAPCAVFTLPDG